MDIDEMVSLARRHYSADYPNPQRRGCPPSGEVVKVVGAGRAPDRALLDHLLECSECYGEYRQALAKRRQEVAVTVTVWKSLASILTLRRILAAVVLLSLGLGARLLLRDSTSTPAVETRVSMEAEATINRLESPAPAGVAPAQRRAEDASRSPGLIVVEVDLDDYSVLREFSEDVKPGESEKPPGPGNEKLFVGAGKKSSQEKIIRLPAARALLALRLPETGVAGEYTVSLVDAFDLVLLSRHAVSRDGARLRVILDLRRIPPEKYRLRLSREGEAPAYYDVIIRKR